MKYVAVCLLVLTAQFCHAAIVPIPGVYSTGVDSGSALLPGGGTQDPHYQIVATTATGFAAPADPYVYGTAEINDVHGVWGSESWTINTPTSQWIGPTANSIAPLDPDWVGTFTYELTFDLTGLDPSTALIQGTWATDNGSQMLLNNVLVATKGPSGYSSLDPFSLTTGFLPGLNVLAFIVTNDANPTPFETWPNPTGLQVNITTATAETPEPVSLLVWSGLTMVLGAVSARRNRK